MKQAAAMTGLLFVLLANPSCSRGSGYIYTSFKKTAKFWWDPWQGGDGAIYSTIDGSGSGYPIAEVDNCSRIIKYVVTVGQRASSYTLVDMRIHDVNVVADLTRHNPTAPDPEQKDGTTYGVTGQEPYSMEIVTLATQHANASTQSWWALDVFWPVLHLLSDSLVEGAAYVVHYTVDLLREVVLLACQFFESPTFQSFLEQLVDKAFYLLFYDLIRVTAVLYTMADYAIFYNPASPITWGLVLAAVAMTFVSLMAPTNYIESGVHDGRYNHGWAAMAYLLLAATCFWMLVEWKTFKGLLSYGTAVALGLFFGVQNMVGGSMALWVEDLFTITTISKLYLAFMLGWFLGAMAAHLSQ